MAGGGLIGGVLNWFNDTVGISTAWDTNEKYYQAEIDKALKQQQFGYDTALKQQQYGYDTALKQQQFSYDSALSAQAAQQELAKQINQQQYEKMMSDTEMQRKIADYQEAGVNPALALGGISNTQAQAGAEQAYTTPQEQKHTAKQQINTDSALILSNAIKSGILQVATKKLNEKAKKLAYNPHNKRLEKSLKQDIFNYYNLIKF